MGMISVETLKEGTDGEDIETSGAQQKTSVLYCAPEMLKMSEANRRRGVEKSWMKQSIEKRQAGDIYGFGMVMYEILFRSLPYPDKTDITELVEYIRDGSRTVRPSIQNRENMNPDLMSLLLDCWSENPDARPSIRRVRLCTETYLKVKGSLVDQMMRLMEQYANNLEKLVQERTGMLEEANKRADNLLSQLLPRYVANELKMGRVVPPKTFAAATVMFSDIVGFTAICSTSKPLEVVTMLNAVYSGFDDIINKHDAYKVETIGDAYMVVSGIPEENGNRHLESIANIALEIMEFLQGFQIPHRKEQRMRIRLGFHTGPVAAGVVGLTAPRYCLFGDTVNTASRMESTGVPEMIQISDATNEQLLKFYPEFRTVKRGTIAVKGKGEFTTYFLEGKNSPNGSDQSGETVRLTDLAQS
uniref:Guanylate cyclase n=1 Tax=Ascaris suum TaxID=6253 RepID=F1L4C9_ASCSU